MSFSYLANGTELYFSIGNFHDSTNSTYAVLTNDYLNTTIIGADTIYTTGAYYFIDDVSITQGQCPVEEVEPVVFVPDAFSPNGDGNNDVLYVRGANIASISFAVYDRWGQQVFYSDHPDKGWDGSYQGSFLNNAVFAYTLHVTFRNGKEKNYSGNVTLFR